MRKQQSLKIDNSWNFFLEPSYYLKLLFTLNTDNRSMEQLFGLSLDLCCNTISYPSRQSYQRFYYFICP